LRVLGLRNQSLSLVIRQSFDMQSELLQADFRAGDIAV
jgi:hypothetical protein